MLKRALLLIRFRPFDRLSETGRAQERHRRILLTAISSLAAKGIAFLSMIISVPLTIGYLGVERYGLWMTISAVVAMLGFADFGLGNGLLNVLSHAHGRDERGTARAYVSSAFFMLSAIGLAVLLTLAVVYPLVPWPRFFNVSTALAAREAGPAVAVVIACFAVALPLGVVDRIQIGYQDGFINNLWSCAGSLLGLILLVVAVVHRASLPWLVLAVSGAPALVAIGNGAILFGLQRPWLRPRLADATWKALRTVSALGIYFFVLQLAVVIAYASDNLVVARVLGAAAVAQYAVPYRLFAIPSIMLTTLLGPLWPAYGEAVARGDSQWVRRTLFRSIKWSVLFSSAASVLLIFFGRWIIFWWAGPQIRPSTMLLVGLGVWTTLGTLGQTIAAFLNGINVLRFQAVTGILMALCNLGLSIILARTWGVAGVIWGTVIAYAALVTLPTLCVLPRLLRSIQLEPAATGL